MTEIVRALLDAEVQAGVIRASVEVMVPEWFPGWKAQVNFSGDPAANHFQVHVEEL